MKAKSLAPKPRRHRFPFGMSFAVLRLLAPWLLQLGCATSQKLPSEAAAPRPNNAVVLMRLAVSADDKPADPFSGKTKFVFTVANRDKEKRGKFLRPVPVQDENFRKEGWAYLLLEPGTYELTAGKLFTYYFAALSTNAQTGVRERIPEKDTVAYLFGDSHAGRGPYRLFVPAHRQLLYAGSFNTVLHKSRGSPASKTTLEFEPETAQRVASAEFNALGPLVLAQLMPTNGLASSNSFPDLGRLAVVTSAPENLEPPHWSDRAAGDYLQAAIVPGAPGGVGAFVLGYDLAAAPFAAMAGAIEGKATKKKWQSCIDGLDQEFASCGVAGVLQMVLLESLRTNGMTELEVLKIGERAVPGHNDCTHILRADVRNVRLIQGARRDLVGAQLALRFRIIDFTEEHCFYDHDFTMKSDFNEMKAYQGEVGRELFRRQMTEVIRSGVEQFLRDVLPTAPGKAKTEQGT